MGINNVFATNTPLSVGQATGGTANWDLAGYDQQIAALTDNGSGTRTIGNSSTTSDSLLSIVGSGFSSFSGVIKDSILTGTRKVSLSVTGGSISLGASNTYSGETIISGATLSLANNGEIGNSASIKLVDGASLYVASRYDGTMVLRANQTLRCAGPITVTGGFECQGMIELAVNKAGSVVNDSLNGASSLTYGGTLKLLLSGNALTTTDTLKLFDASGYGGAFSSIVPAAPGSGLAWDTSTLTTDGTLRIMPGAVTPPSVQSAVMGNQMILSASGGAVSGTCYVLTSIDVALALGSWTPISTNTFDSQGQFSFTNEISAGVQKRFFILKLP